MTDNKDFSKGLIKTKTGKYDKYHLTNSQYKAILAIEDWFFNNKSSQFTLSGSAGTGKSFLTNVIIKEIFKTKRIVVSAPTHKAVRVIEKFTKRTGKTIHSLHGLRPNFNIDDLRLDKLKFESLGLNKFNEYDLILMDESSMIPKEVKKLNDIRSTQYNTKILYVGDKLQLPPVRETGISSIFNNEHRFNLTDIVRQDNDNSLSELLLLLRIDVLNGTSKFINYISKHPTALSNGLGYSTFNRRQYETIIKSLFNNDYFKYTHKYRLTTYTNDRVNIWNNYIREMVVKSDDIITINDVLMSYKTVVDENMSTVIINSNDYKVISSEAKLSDDGFKVFVVELLDLDTLRVKKVFIVDHTHPTFYSKYYNKLYYLHHNARYCDDPLQKGSMWKMFYNYKDRYLTMVDFTIYDKQTHRKISYIKKELDYGYAVTIHKLQGSTIETILMDNMNIIYWDIVKKLRRTNSVENPNVINMRNRLLYTGLSRASNKGLMLYY
jgi:hypothetical protein